MTDEFVTAEESTPLRSCGWVMVTTSSMMIDGRAIPSRFVVTTHNGYRVEVRACMSDRCTGDKPVPRCTRDLDDRHMHSGQSVDRWLKHVQISCHGWHVERVRALAADVAKSYGSARKVDAPKGLLGHPKRVSNVGAKTWAENPYAMALEGRAPAGRAQPDC